MSPYLYDIAAYRAMLKRVRGITATNLLDPEDLDRHRGINRGDRVRGKFFTVTAHPMDVNPNSTDPLRVDSGLRAVGKPLLHCTAYELMAYAIGEWDLKAKIVAAGTNLRLMTQDGAGHTGYTAPAFAYLANIDGCPRIRVGFREDFSPLSRMLCIIEE